MKVALIISGVIAMASLVLELVSRAVAKRGRQEFDKMGADEKRKHQEEMYRTQQLA